MILGGFCSFDVVLMCWLGLTRLNLGSFNVVCVG